MSRLSFLGKKSEPLLGIDIGTSSVKVLELSKNGSGKISVVSAVQLPIPPNVVVDKKINEPDKLADVVRKAVQYSRSKAKSAVVCVPGSAVITRNLDLPVDAGNEDELESMLLLEAEQYIPYSLDEVALDFSVLGESENNPGNSHVLLAACRKETVDVLQSVLEQAGLAPKIVDVEPFCIERVFPYIADQFAEDRDGLIAIVDVGYTVLTINILEAGRTVFTREELFGSRQLTEEVQRRYGLSHDEAVEAERQGDLPEDYESEVLVPFQESLASQVHRSLQFFYSSTQSPNVDSVLLVGGLAGRYGLVERMEQKMDVPVYAVNPFLGMSVSSGIDSVSLARDASQYLLATGLALRGVAND